MKSSEIIKELLSLKDEIRAQHCLRFFKTGPGQYGEGDKFLGLSNPQIRALVRKYVKELSVQDIEEFVQSEFHEIRLFGLLCWVYQFQHSKEENIKKAIFDLYVKNRRSINNWDLVDLSAPQILGPQLPFDIALDWAKSTDLWERRLAIMSTFHDIRNGNYNRTIELSEILLHDKHDLIHKAVGWMLREVGKKDIKTLRAFLDKHSKVMPRTMLRYAVEKLTEVARKNYMK